GAETFQSCLVDNCLCSLCVQAESLAPRDARPVPVPASWAARDGRAGAPVPPVHVHPPAAGHPPPVPEGRGRPGRPRPRPQRAGRPVGASLTRARWPARAGPAHFVAPTKKSCALRKGAAGAVLGIIHTTTTVEKRLPLVVNDECDILSVILYCYYFLVVELFHRQGHSYFEKVVVAISSSTFCFLLLCFFIHFQCNLNLYR
ncbi:unnamed protein product, partial [Heterosigma akashiwo]